MVTIFELLATLAAGIFTGAALFVHLVGQPAWMELEPILALRAFNGTLERAKVMQPLLAILAVLGSVLAWVAGGTAWWLLGGAALGFLIPFTLIWMLSIHQQLEDRALEEDPARGRVLLEKWGQLHFIRCMISLGAFFLFLLLLKWA